MEKKTQKHRYNLHKRRIKNHGKIETFEGEDREEGNSLSDALVAARMRLGLNPTMQSINRAKPTQWFSFIFFFLLPLSLSLSKTRWDRIKTWICKFSDFCVSEILIFYYYYFLLLSFRFYTAVSARRRSYRAKLASKNPRAIGIAFGA